MAEEKKVFSEEEKKAMVSRFLNWKLPEHFNPDGGVVFARTYNGWDSDTGTVVSKTRQHGDPFWPVGTNLFTADQAREMVEHMLGD